MNQRTFIQAISESNFKELFIREMGWNNPRGQLCIDITVENDTYTFKFIAERSGFQVMTCQVEEIPTSSIVKKIDIRLRRQANDYICIFHLPNGSEHHLWAAPVKKVEKRDVVLIEYESAQKAGFLYEKIDGLSFGLDERTTIMDVKERVQGAFVINSEKITKDFYLGFRKEHTNFAKFISGIDDEISDIKQNHNKQWYASVMLNRLMFCYFIQKKRFLDRNTDYLREKLAWVKQEQGENKFYSFYRGFLISLFHDGLNSPRREPDFVKKYGRIPYLNGGMFDIHELERQYTNIDIKDDAFESLFSFFDQWHWHLDDRLTATGKDINPDVLGYIFEQYINDRAQMGAYYTKEDITEYIGRNTILPYLLDATKKADEKPFRIDGFVWDFLKHSGDKYIFDAVKKGHDISIPDYISVGIDTTHSNLLERRSRWNERAPEEWALPTEIWRETIERLQRYQSICKKIEDGEIHEINDFITYNLDIRQFVLDLLSQTDDHLFVLHFYHALQKVTILDPTCGSGAFLFAAMNILEPLYEICISRMQDWQSQNQNLFKEELEELNIKYRNNQRYFIYKSIILRNLYGVDIMVEATEIAKLRLFLKMMAVVDVDPHDANLGLEPLPDVDFNIRCGNTLVGYATEQELQDGVMYTDMFAALEFEQKVKDEMKKVSMAYDTFKHIQLGQNINLENYKLAKKELKLRLKGLNDILNKNLHSATNPYMAYEAWEKSHQPFHWIAEYYDIIHGNGGFDVIVGNPPYVEMNDVPYDINFTTDSYSNLYAYCLQRCNFITTGESFVSLIVPMSISSIREYEKMRLFLRRKYKSLYLTNHAIRPISLFNGVSQRVSIVIATNSCAKQFLYTTDYIRTNNRDLLFKTIHYEIGCFEQQRNNIIPKIGSSIYRHVYDKIHKQPKTIMSFKEDGGSKIYLKDYGETYWIFPFNFDPCLTPVKSYKVLSFDSNASDNVYISLNSTLFYVFYTAIADCWHLGIWHLSEFPIDIKAFNGVCIANKLSLSMKENRIIRYDKRAGGDIYEYKIFRSKLIIDEIDKILSVHYGFTEEELDFIINYNIKYRMGDEMNS